MNLLDKKKFFENKKDELEKLLSSPDLISNQQRYQSTAKDHAATAKILYSYEDYEKCLDELESNKQMLKETPDSETEFLSVINEDILNLQEKIDFLEKDIIQRILPKGEDEGRNLIVEIRAGTGGDEASLFASEIYRMYCKFAEKNDLIIESLESSESGMGGLKEIIFSVKGNDAFEKFRFESGTHRVQRVPVTESSGRIHTSAITVAILPEPKDVEVDINPNDIRIDTFRASGCGGQSVNTMDSAVRIIHLPTKTMVSCQDEKSQHKNKVKAMRILKARVLEKKRKEDADKRSQARKNQVGSGDRSEKIRTYNFPQNRFTDHRINLSLYSLDNILDGHLEEAIMELSKALYEKLMADNVLSSQ